MLFIKKKNLYLSLVRPLYLYLSLVHLTLKLISLDLKELKKDFCAFIKTQKSIAWKMTMDIITIIVRLDSYLVYNFYHLDFYMRICYSCDRILSGKIICPYLLALINFSTLAKSLLNVSLFRLEFHNRTLYGDNSPMDRILWRGKLFEQKF